MADTKYDKDYGPLDLKDREAHPEDAPGPGQNAYDDEVQKLTNPEHYSKNAEKPPTAAGPESEDKIPYKPEEPAPAGAKKGGTGKLRGALGVIKKNKLKLIVGGGVLVVPGLALLLLQLGSLLFPNLAQHMESNRFRRITRHYTNNMNVIMAHKIALDRSNDDVYRQALEFYKDDGTSMMSKINKWRPNKVAEQLVIDMKFNYGEPYKITIAGRQVTRQKLISVTIDGQEIPIPENTTSLKGKIQHPRKFMQANREYRAAIKKLLTTDSKLRNLMVRGDASRKVRNVLGGVKLWRYSKVDVDKANSEPVDTQKAAIEETRRSAEVTQYDAEGRKAAASASDGDIADEAHKTVDETTACLKDNNCVGQLIQEGDGVTAQSKQRLASAFKTSGIREVANGVSVAAEGLQMAALMCLFTGNGVRSSEAVIAANTAMAVRSGASVSAVAGQQRFTQLTGQQRIAAVLVSGYAAQVGDIYQSNPEIIARGGAVDTSNSPSPHAAANGTYETDPNIPIPGSAINDFNRFCSVATNGWTVGIATTAEILISLIPGVGQGIKAAGTVTFKGVFKIVSKELFSLIKGMLTPRELSRFGAVLSVEQLAAYFARGLALNYAATGFSGLAQGAAYVNQADAGMTAYGQATDAVQNASLPLKAGEYQAVDPQDRESQIALRQNQSTYNRYFALNNADSLASHLATASYGNLRFDRVSSVAQTALHSLNPMNIVAKLPFFASSRAGAAGNPMRTFEYGVVPVGWTPDEENAFLDSDDFSMFHNDKTLADSGQKPALQEKFGKCFSGDFAPLLANGDIVRNSEAEVLDGGLCDRKNMGDNGPPSDGKLTFASAEAEMAFRWRVWIRHNNTMNDMEGIENPQPDSDPGAIPGGDGVVTMVNGVAYSLPVGPQVKINYTDVPCRQADLKCHHDNTPAMDFYHNGKPSNTMDNHPIYAFTDGVVERVAQFHQKRDGNLLYPWDPRCRSIQLKSDAKDGGGWYYAYLHVWNVNVKPGTRVKAGQQIAQVAPYDFGPGCRALGPSHLHFDRGCRRDGVPQYGGGKSCRDGGVVPIMNQVWEALPPPAPGQEP